MDRLKLKNTNLKIKLKILLLFIIHFYFHNNCVGQEQLSFIEKFTITTNNNIFIVGETLYYNVFITDKSNVLSNSSKIGYCYLINSDKKIVLQQKIIINNGVLNGDFIIPSILQTGNYKLVITTNNSLLKSTINNQIIDIYLINPFNNQDINLKEVDTVYLSKSKFTIDDKNIPIFNTRSLVTFDFNNKELIKGNYIVSAKRIDSVKISKKFLNKVKNSVDKSIIPEIRGEIISGVLYDLDNKPIENKYVSLSITNNQNIFKISKTNSEGVFYFNIFENYNDGDLIINLFNKDSINNYKIKLFDKHIPFINNLKFNNLRINKDLKNWLKSKSIYSQIENIYFNLKKDSLLIKNKAKMFYGNLSTNYLLDDYTRFFTIKETFTEVITSAYSRTIKDENLFYVHFNNLKIKLKNNYKALVLIDGILINDGSILYNFNPKLIKQINTIDEYYIYGSKIFGGIIDVKTFKGDFYPSVKNIIFKTHIKSPIFNKIYFTPDYKNFGQLKHIPDYRTQLLWDPNLKFEKGIISFYSSDVKGLYELNINGFSNSGEKINISKYFIIK